ncbi:hypothetical protein CY34DRAFT_157990 [Suillus luteus UH-Slu-Lm8-n1]|uniref:Uncharacterized protein n=1 Tax=Suillus luteus UH-Slu-Lm8-n1 TaxID=930992 RepID=A0A0D0AK05_9AGAM|nr:hypothetical protein CY34DRAFT_157990 [Suillus luteus UH-Slu-Lm8-n1]
MKRYGPQIVSQATQTQIQRNASTNFDFVHGQYYNTHAIRTFPNTAVDMSNQLEKNIICSKMSNTTRLIPLLARCVLCVYLLQTLRTDLLLPSKMT